MKKSRSLSVHPVITAHSGQLTLPCVADFKQFGEAMCLSFVMIAVLLGGCSTARVIPDEASAAVPPDYVTRHQLPVTLERAALILSHFGHTGDELVFVNAEGKKFTVYRLLGWRKDTPLFSPSREVGRLAVGDSQTETRLVDYRGEEGRALLRILSSVPDGNEGSGMTRECAAFLQKKRKGLPNQATQIAPGPTFNVGWAKR